MHDARGRKMHVKLLQGHNVPMETRQAPQPDHVSLSVVSVCFRFLLAWQASELEPEIDGVPLITTPSVAAAVCQESHEQ